MAGGVEQVGGALLGFAFSELGKAVREVKDRGKDFENQLRRLEQTLRDLNPMIEDIKRINTKLEESDQREIDRLASIMTEGNKLVSRCLRVSQFNILKKSRYQKKLVELDNEIIRFHNTLIQLRIFQEVKKLHLELRSQFDKLSYRIQRLNSSRAKEMELLISFYEELETLLSERSKIAWWNFVKKRKYKRKMMEFKKKFSFARDMMQTLRSDMKNNESFEPVRYDESAGVEFPLREENRPLLFTPPQTPPIDYLTAEYDEAAIQASLQSDASVLSLLEIQNAQRLAEVLLMGMLTRVLNPKDPEALEEEVIVNLVDQCRSYQKWVMLLVNNTADQQLLRQGSALNDSLQRVLGATARGVVNDRHRKTGRGLGWKKKKGKQMDTRKHKC